ncbi:unnamed protein product [Diatraea saccharalis]|uniref:Uncharacterized protein n=1 Tax=Diatraea saccharalis TaxID=40085 RepID=A0A9N9R414_9NEOP|nr:unnamed protein product [Diatraea saccharalis]
MLCSGLYNDMRIYDAIRNEDMGQAVMITMNAMKEKNLFPPLQKQRKCETMSNQYRNQGNNAYKQANYQTALESYNKALLSAPKGTNAMSIAYANRSALLYTIKLYQACLKDIEMSIAFDCPSHIVEKLMKRKKLAESNIWKEKLVEEVRFSNRKGFPDFDFPRNPEIPCASTDIDIIMESGLPQVIAAKNIKVGTILAVEQAYCVAWRRRNETMHFDATTTSSNLLFYQRITLPPASSSRLVTHLWGLALSLRHIN